jgi:hypothetical protein
MKRLGYAAFLLLASLALTSCSSSTLIRSDPSGAKVYLNEQYRGVTPYLYSDQKIVGSATRIKLTKEGYEDFYAVLTRDERVDAGAVVGGLIFFFPFLWVMEYDPVHTYELTPKVPALTLTYPWESLEHVDLTIEK